MKIVEAGTCDACGNLYRIVDGKLQHDEAACIQKKNQRAAENAIFEQRRDDAQNQLITLALSNIPLRDDVHRHLDAMKVLIEKSQWNDPKGKNWHVWQEELWTYDGDYDSILRKLDRIAEKVHADTGIDLTYNTSCGTAACYADIITAVVDAKNVLDSIIP